MQFDCMVIGGGAAGMMAAITAARNGVSTAVIEHSNRIGKKILQTGNGKCNLTNLEMNRDCYLCDDKDFVMSVIEQFNSYDTIDFFKLLGVYPKSKNGYIYPNSEQASSVLDVLRYELEHLGVVVLTETDVEKVEKEAYLYKVFTSSAEYICKTLILSTGSKAAPKTGSDGSGFRLAKELGHSIIKPLPALVQLKSNLNLFKAVSGVRSEGRVDLYVDGQLVVSDSGEIQYTDYGISGIPVFQISRYAVRAVDAGKKTEVVIDMLPSIKHSDMLDMFRRRLPEEGYKTYEQFFTGVLNKKLAGAALRRSGVQSNEKVINGIEKLEKVLSLIKAFPVPINGYQSFENAQTCSGGVRTSQINGKTMQSKILDNLFFAGEMVDVDGICGGYNLQWAWSSGYVAGFHASMAVKTEQEDTAEMRNYD